MARCWRALVVASLLVLSTLAGPLVGAGVALGDSGETAVPSGAEDGDATFTGGTVDASNAVHAASAGPSTEVDRTTVEVRSTFRQVDERGVVEIELTHRPGEGVYRAATRLPEDATVTDPGGFRTATADGRTVLWWSGVAKERTATLRYAANETSDRFGTPWAVDAGDWALVGVPYFRTEGKATGEEGVTVVRASDVAGEGYAGGDLVYLGPYDAYRAETRHEPIRLVVPEAVDLADPEATLRELAFAAERTGTGGSAVVDADGVRVRGSNGGEVVAFAVGDPLRPGRAQRSDFFVNVEADAGFGPESLWYHEYAHVRQSYERDRSAKWLNEGWASYHAALTSWEAGHASYGEFAARLARGAGDDAVLADPETWGELTDYRKGALVCAALDARIRAASDGERTLDDAFRRLNEQDGPVSNADLRAAAEAAAGEDLDGFFERYVTGTASPPVPDRDAFARGWDADVAAEIEVEAHRASGGQVALDVVIRNVGDDAVVSPVVTVDSAALESVELRDEAAGSAESREEGWRVRSVRPGEQRRLRFVAATAPAGGFDDEVGVTVSAADGSTVATTATASVPGSVLAPGTLALLFSVFGGAVGVLTGGVGAAAAAINRRRGPVVPRRTLLGVAAAGVGVVALSLVGLALLLL